MRNVTYALQLAFGLMVGCAPHVARPPIEATPAAGDLAFAPDAPGTPAAIDRARNRLHFGTRSIAACDPATGECGIAVVSFPSGTGVVVPVGEPGVAIANQAWPNIYTARSVVDAVLAGVHPTAALDAALAADPEAALRQMAVAALWPDSPSGVAVATFIGDNVPDELCSLTGDTYSVVADEQTSSALCQAMADGFVAARGSLGRRLLAALKAGAVVGGDARGEYSAGIRIFQNTSNLGRAGVTVVNPDASVDRARDWQSELEFGLNSCIAVSHEEYPADRVPFTSTMQRDILSVLADLRYYNGNINRGWSSAAEQALRHFGWYNCFFPRGTVESSGQLQIDGVLAAYIIEGHRRGVLRARP